jgi:hypothetical protein
MPTPSRLNQVAQKLETDPNSTRIKKVLLCAYNGKWENDAKALNKIQWNHLLQNIYQKYPQFESLKITLNNILSRLNKKNEYSRVIHALEEHISPLYDQSEPIEALAINQPSITASETVKISPEELNSLSSAYLSQMTLANLNNNISDLFDVRFKIMQHTNPLRAKLVIFSSLEREFNYREEDWVQLKNQSLDTLLRQLLHTFPTVDRLKSHLYKMAEYLEDADENMQVVTVILEALSPYYEPNSKSYSEMVQPSHPSILQQHFLTSQAIDINESETLQLLPPDAQALSFVLGGEQKVKSSAINESSFSDFTLATSLSNIEGREIEAEGVNDGINQQKQHLELEADQKINHSVADSLVPLTTILKHLESSLDESLKNYSAEIQLEIKYQSLRKYIHLLKGKIEDLETVINQSETEEQQRLLLNKTMMADASEDPDNLQQRLTQPQLLQLARQGHAKAIATVISQFLKPRGISTLAKSKDACLHIILESDQVPNQASMIPFVYQKLLDLKLKSIQKVKVYARTPGNKSMAWVQEFTYTETYQ